MEVLQLKKVLYWKLILYSFVISANYCIFTKNYAYEIIYIYGIYNLVLK